MNVIIKALSKLGNFNVTQTFKNSKYFHKCFLFYIHLYKYWRFWFAQLWEKMAKRQCFCNIFPGWPARMLLSLPRVLYVIVGAKQRTSIGKYWIISTYIPVTLARYWYSWFKICRLVVMTPAAFSINTCRLMMLITYGSITFTVKYTHVYC
jgi:hypothetical protein